MNGYLVFFFFYMCILDYNLCDGVVYIVIVQLNFFSNSFMVLQIFLFRQLIRKSGKLVIYKEVLLGYRILKKNLYYKIILLLVVIRKYVIK